MESHPRISELLIKTGAYSDLPEPVVLTSGELGIYYINTEKLCQDDGEWKKYGDDSSKMIRHAIRMTEKHPEFKEVIDIIAETAMGCMDYPDARYFISGGQRRDWLFSGPVAHKLGCVHVSLYKKGTIELIDYEGKICELQISDDKKETRTVHISDLLTEGSSAYRVENKKENGWIPTLRKEGIDINDLITVVTRQQGGEEILAKQGVNVEAFVAIDEDFLNQYSNNPKRAVSYMQNPRLWSENYLRENGALALIETFNPKQEKLDRARKFLDRYGNVLVEANKWNELNSKVNKRYSINLGQISGDVD